LPPKLTSIEEVKTMPKFIVVHTEPVTKEQWMIALKPDMHFPEGYTWKHTYCDFKNGKFFCEWDAPSKEQLKAGLKSMFGFLPVDEVYPVEVYIPAEKKFED